VSRVTSDKPNLPHFKADKVIGTETAGGVQTNYESYWALLKAENPPSDPNAHMWSADEIAGFAKSANAKNVSQVGQNFLDFYNALNKISLPGKGELPLTDFILELGKELHKAWSGGATAAPEAQRQLTLLYQSAKELMDTSAQAGYTIKAHGDNVLPQFTKWFDGSDDTLDKETSSYIDNEWKKDNYDKYPALQGAGHTRQDELDLGRAEQAAMKAFRDDWARKKLAEHNTNVSTSYDGLPYSLLLSFPPGTDVPASPDPTKDTGDHGRPTTPPATPHHYAPPPSTPSAHHVPTSTGHSGSHPSGTVSGVTNTGLIDHNGSNTPVGTDLSGVGNPTDLNNPSGTNLNTPPGLGGGTNLNPNTGPGPTVGLGGGGSPFTSYNPGLIKSPSLENSGLGKTGSDPLGVKTPGGATPKGAIGPNGTVNTAAAAQTEEAAAAATAANATQAAGSPSMIPPMLGGGQRQQEHDRDRGTWLPEEIDFWASGDEVAPPVIE
jgi:hypothetical protein